MKNILKPIFEMITGEYVLFNNITYNYIAMGIVGTISFIVAWELVGKMYRDGSITSKSGGSIIHWTVRIVIFTVLFYLLCGIIWVTRFLYLYRWILLILLIISIIAIVIIKIIKKNKKIDANKKENADEYK